jgi:hypothetical protein
MAAFFIVDRADYSAILALCLRSQAMTQARGNPRSVLSVTRYRAFSAQLLIYPSCNGAGGHQESAAKWARFWKTRNTWDVNS